MRRERITRTIPAIGLGLALSYTSAALGQGLPPSSGSGAGTGTGMSSGFPGSTGTGAEGIPSSPLRPAFPAGNLTRPIDRPYDPSLVAPGGGGISTVSPDLFLDARSVSDPGERALALVRIAQTAIFSKQLDEAHTALFEAGPAALAAPDPLIREQRLTAIVGGLLSLAEERMGGYADIEPAPIDDTPPAPAPAPAPPGTPARPSNLPQGTPPTPAPAGSPLPAPSTPAVSRPPATALPEDTRRARLRAALPEWAQAVDLARRIERVTARTETLFRIVESEAFSSQRIITDPLRLSGGRPDPARLSPDIRAFTDGLLASAATHAAMIERPIWRNNANYSIISNAAASSQFARGFQIARGIDQPEARTDALIRLAEGQALNGRPEEATAAYSEAARSVSLVPQEDPRETLIGVLIDSLISFGRFDDARACVPLYGYTSRQIVALSAVAESQGRRGLAESARLWIGRDASPAFRPLLYRKVNDGILASIEQNRSKDLSSRGQ